VQQLLLELNPKADVADKNIADARGQEALPQQFFEPVLTAPPREAPWWQATQRRHSIAAPATSKTAGSADFSHLQRSQSISDLPEPGLSLFAQNGSIAAPATSKTTGSADFSHHGLSVGLGNLQRSQSIFDLPEPGLSLFAQNSNIAAPATPKTTGCADFSHHGLSVGLGDLQRSQSIFDLPDPGFCLFAQNGSIPTPVRHVLQPPRGLNLEKISAGFLPPGGLLNPFMGPATNPQAACRLGVDYSSMRHSTSMATQRCALQGVTTPPPYFGSFSMAQRSSIEYRRMAMQ